MLNCETDENALHVAIYLYCVKDKSAAKKHCDFNNK